MKKIISLLVVSILVGLSNVSADTSSETGENGTGTTVSASATLYTQTGSTEQESDTESSTGTTSEESSTGTTTEESSTGTTSENSTTNNDGVKEVQKSFVGKFNELKGEFKDRMENKEARNEYMKQKNELFNEYKAKLHERIEAMKEKREEIRIEFKEKKQEVLDNLKAKREAVKKKYDTTYGKKYGKMISNLSKEKVEILITKIDELVVKVNTGEYSDEAKARLIAMLESLKDLAQKRLDNLNMEAELNIDALFQD